MSRGRFSDFPPLFSHACARQLPIDLLIRLAQYYGVSTDYILELTDNPAPYPPKSKKK